MKHLYTIILFVAVSIVNMETYASYDGKPWDDSEYHSTPIGPVILGLIIISVVFFLIPKIATKKRKDYKATKKGTVKSQISTMRNPMLTKCPKCNGTGILKVPRYKCPFCNGIGKIVEEPLKAKILANLKDKDIIPNYIRNASQETLEGFNPINKFNHFPFVFTLTRDESLELYKCKICNHCKGIGSVDDKLCSCFYDENGTVSSHVGYIDFFESSS